ncbi:MAG: Gfo/Idh/MocA family oxidoreductase [Chloroflexi bacterium]|nr:Gfo/Idh/MocA family oxidoreductase [Chloroflexota bacterium]
MLNVGVLGAGTMGTLHAHHLCQIPNVRLVGVTALPANEADALASSLGIQRYDSSEALLADPAIDAVVIATPTPTHAELIMAAARAGKHIFCEKPLARHLEDGQRAIEACREAGVSLMIGHVVRFFPEYERIKELIDQGAIGKPAMLRFSRVAPFPRAGQENWYANTAASGGVILDLMLHDIDTLRWYCGDILRVYAHSLTGRTDVERDYALVTMRMASGAIAHLEGSWAHPGGFRTRVEIAGDGGLLSVDSRESAPIQIERWMTEGRGGGVALPESPLAESPYLVELRHWVDHVVNGTPLRVTPEDALKALEAGLAAMESADTGQVISLVRGGVS